MSLTPTTDKALGFIAPAFSLIEPKTQKQRNLSELKSNTATVIMFICNHCPYVVHIKKALVQLANDYHTKGISFIAINSNDSENYPADSPDMMVKDSERYHYPFPYLFDETQEVAKAYDAACTPDFSIFDKEMKCVYRGQLDDSRPNSGIPVTGKDIRKVLDSILNNKKISEDQRPSIGCNIKWK